MKTSQKSLLASGVSLLASAALLVGATFAWFTDSVVNTGNKIQAGKLAINAYAYDLAEDGTGGFEIEGVNDGNPFKFKTQAQDLKKDKSPIIDDTDFEPGKSNAKLLKVENAGTLAAKIKLDFTVTDGGLMDALWFDFVQVKDGAIVGEFARKPMSELETIAEGFELPLLKGENVQFILVYGMNEGASNTYMEKTFTADVAIAAAQYTEEKDGFGNNQYDKGANYDNAKVVVPESGDTLTTEELRQALNDPEWPNIRFASDVTVDDYVNLYTDSHLDFDGNTVSTTKTLYIGRNNSYGSAPVTVTLRNGTVSISGSSGRLRAEDSCNVTFEDMTFTSADGKFVPALQVYAEKADGQNTYIFKNCVFDNTYVAFEGSSGRSYDYDIHFIGCTFTATPGNGGSLVAIDDYVYGSASFKDCTFAVTANGNATAAVCADSYSSYVAPHTMDITLENVTFTGTSKEDYFGKKTPVPVRVKDAAATTVTELGGCAYTTDGQAVTVYGKVIAQDIIGSLQDPDVPEVVAGKDIDMNLEEFQENNGNCTVVIPDGKTLDLNRNTIIRPASGSGDGLSFEAGTTATVKNGTVFAQGDMKAVDIGEGASVTFEDMVFEGHGSENLKVRAKSGVITTVVFRNCTFNNAPVILSGRDGATEIDIRFIGCTFTGTYKMYDDEGNVLTDPHGNIHYTQYMISAASNYLYGDIRIEGCTFAFDASEARYSEEIIELYGCYQREYPGKMLNVLLKDVTMTGAKVTPVDIDFRYEDGLVLTEEGSNTYTVDGVEVNYDGSAK